ncbi:DNA helicase [Candidatus Dependentiae bacterium Noda2021]|nr:DNA helicase [Candidatus Dependentiae bacterium Noda2021]
MNEQTTFNDFISNKLNPAQEKAVTTIKGPLLVVAGAGSGKTRVITARIAHLMINHDVQPHEIVALTFTNKAAREMKERIEQFLGSSKMLPFIGTFHSYCLRLLKKHAHLLDNPFISILDEDDQHKILQGIITRNGLNKKITAKQLSYQISQIKNQSLHGIQYDLANNKMIEEIYRAYEHEKTLSKTLDFDDLLLQTVSLLKKNSLFRNSLQHTIRHLLVDEYQDTNIVQHELLKYIALGNDKQFTIDSVCVVGDEDQSIYSWRGATVANILNFTKDFKNTEIITIEQNYRSAQPILDIANHVIEHNNTRNPKRLWSEKKGNDRARALVCLSEYQEAEAIAQLLKSITLKNKTLDSVAVLYRTHFQSRAIEEALIKHSIPYKIVGGVQFYERKEIKDILGYLKLSINPFDRPSFLRVINSPLRGLGAQFEELFHSRWSLEPFLSFKDVAQKLIQENLLTKVKQQSLIAFIDIFEAIDLQSSPEKAVEHILQRTNYYSFLKEEYEPQEAIIRIENIKELIGALHHLHSTGIKTIAQFLDEVALMQEHYRKEDSQGNNPVLLMTLHAAKGLEFNTVILTGLEEGMLPSTRSLTNEEQVEEERRLFYVGITRAEERILITHCRYRYTFGTMTDQRSSRFMGKSLDACCQLKTALIGNKRISAIIFLNGYRGLGYIILMCKNLQHPVLLGHNPLKKLSRKRLRLVFCGKKTNRYAMKRLAWELLKMLK